MLAVLGINETKGNQKMKMKNMIVAAVIAGVSIAASLNAAIVRVSGPDKTTKPGFVINTFSNTVTGVVRARTNNLSRVVTRRGRVSARGGAAFRRSAPRAGDSSFLTKEQEKFYSSYTRQVAQEIITITNVQYVVATWRKGNDLWQTTNQVIVIQGRQQTDKIGEVETRVAQLEKIFPVHYSKLKLIMNLKAVGKWKDVRAQLEEADLMDEWNASMFILDSHPFFISATNNAIQAGICTEKEIVTLLQNSIDE